MYLQCPRCQLSILVHADYLAPRNCPRCMGRHRIAVPMSGTPNPPRHASGSGVLSDPSVANVRQLQLRRAAPGPGTETAA